MKRRGKSALVEFLDANNKDNELTISVNAENWVILINGNDISDKFGTTLKHNSQYKYVTEVIEKDFISFFQPKFMVKTLLTLGLEFEF